MEDAPFERGVVVSIPGLGELPNAAQVELGSVGNGGVVDPVAGERLGEHVGGVLVVLHDDVGVVGVASAGERRVDAAAEFVGLFASEEKENLRGTGKVEHSLGGIVLLTGWVEGFIKGATLEARILEEAEAYARERVKSENFGFRPPTRDPE